MKVDKIFKRITRLPNWLNWVFLRFNVFGSLLYGKMYKRKSKSIGVQIHEDRTFVTLINTFFESTSYYAKKNLMISSLLDFKMNIDFINKEIVLENFNDFLSKFYNERDYIEGTTGGTTGKPMRIIMPKERYGFELPIVHSYWKEYGWNFHPRAVIRNHKLKMNEKFRINPFTKEIIFDAFRQEDEYIRFIHNFLIKKKVRFVQAYPSSAYLFCKRCKELGLEISFIQAFFTSSEPVHQFQRIFIEDELGIQLFNFYGHSEKLLIAGNCKQSDYYHFEPSYGFAELIDAEGKDIKLAGQIGNLVGSTYNNFGTPLVRYMTGDSAEFVGNSCPKCGKKALTVRNIIGHYNDNLVYKNIGYTTTTALNLHSELYKTIDGLQYIQYERGKLKVCVKPNLQFNNDFERQFLSHFNHAMGEGSEVELIKVQEFQILSNGKMPLLISYVKNEFK